MPRASSSFASASASSKFARVSTLAPTARAWASFAACDGALGLEDHRFEPGARRVGGSRGGSVPGRGADDGARTVRERLS